MRVPLSFKNTIFLLKINSCHISCCCCCCFCCCCGCGCFLSQSFSSQNFGCSDLPLRALRSTFFEQNFSPQQFDDCSRWHGIRSFDGCAANWRRWSGEKRPKNEDKFERYINFHKTEEIKKEKRPKN